MLAFVQAQWFSLISIGLCNLTAKYNCTRPLLLVGRNTVPLINVSKLELFIFLLKLLRYVSLQYFKCWNNSSRQQIPYCLTQLQPATFQFSTQCCLWSCISFKCNFDSLYVYIFQLLALATIFPVTYDASDSLDAKSVKPCRYLYLKLERWSELYTIFDLKNFSQTLIRS